VAAPIDVSRAQVLGYRFAAHQLDRSAPRRSALAVLALGLQDSGGSAPLIVDARVRGEPQTRSPADAKDLTLVWSLRGAPHWHRRAEAGRLAAALWPLSEKDAETRLGGTGRAVVRAGESASEMFAAAARALRTVVDRAVTKGAASTAVTPLVPAALTSNCRACGAVHISDLAMRLGSLPAGLELEPGTSPPVLRRRPRGRVVDSGDPAAFGGLVRHFLALTGPAGPSEVAWFFAARRADVVAHWPADLVEIAVEGRSGRFLPAEAARRLRRVGTGRTDGVDVTAVRLLAPFDPFLQTSDRDLLVPSRGRQKQLWPVLGRPGALVAGGEVIGMWRPSKSGARLAVRVQPFSRLSAAQRRAVEVEAERMGVVRGADQVSVDYR
jgi:hypothetical protein